MHSRQTVRRTKCDPAAIRSLHVVFGLDNKLGGAVHAALGIARALIASGHPAEVVATWEPTDDTAYLTEEFKTVPCHFLPRTYPKHHWYSADFAPWLNRNLERFDLVELHSAWAAATFQGWRGAARAGKPFLLRPHSSLDPFDVKKHAIWKRALGPCLIRPMLQQSAGVVLTAQLEADRMVTYGAQPRRFIAPLPISRSQMPLLSARDAFRRKYRIPLNATVVLFLSRIDKKKGLQFLIPAIARLRKDRRDLYLLLVGSGDATTMEDINRMLARSGLNAYTIQTGFLGGTPKLEALVASDVFALPSLNENFGIAVVEAMQAGLPVLISNEVYIHDEIERAAAGMICAPSAESCEGALRKLLALSPEARKAMGDRGRALAETAFSPETVCRRNVDLYCAAVHTT
jgi:glycosyltransferase involved in cell wall biosynthesis